MNRDKLIGLIRNDEWSQLIGLIEDHTYDMDENLINGNNIFHIACIRLNEDFMRKYQKSKIRNPNKLNEDGLIGLQLYYKYGGNCIDFLQNNSICHHDINGNTAIQYIDDENMIINYLENAIKNNCLESILYTRAIQRTLYIDALNKKHLKVIDILIRYVDPINIIYLSIFRDDINTINYFLNVRSIDPMIRDPNNITPLIIAVKLKKHDTVKLLLNRIESIHSLVECYQSIIDGGDIMMMNPILISINSMDQMMITILLDTIDRYFDKYAIRKRILYQCDRYLNNAGHILLRVLTGTSQELIIEWTDILIRIIRYTEINQENYSGTSVAHMLFSSGLWKVFNKKNLYNILAEKKIDVFHLDENGNNIYTYIEKDDYYEFMEFMKKIGIQLNIDTLNQDIKLNSIQIANPQNYGKFNANLSHNMIYMDYLMKTYPSLYIPSISYNRSKKKFRLLTNKMLFYKTTYKEKIIHQISNQMINLFYRYTPHYIIWGGKNHHLIDQNLEQSLIDDMASNTRFVLIKITLIIDVGTIHSNMALYCKKTKVMRRFEPTGINRILDGDELDQLLKSIFEKVYGEIKYLRPEDYMTCATFQLTSADEIEYNKNLGDPYGYCLAWGIWFIEMRLKYPDEDDRTLYRNAIDRKKVNLMIGKNDPNIRSDNYYLDYIRNYANDLDEIKNKLMGNMGILENEKYMLYPSTNTLQILKKYFRK